MADTKAYDRDDDTVIVTTDSPALQRKRILYHAVGQGLRYGALLGAALAYPYYTSATAQHWARHGRSPATTPTSDPYASRLDGMKATKKHGGIGRGGRKAMAGGSMCTKTRPSILTVYHWLRGAAFGAALGVTLNTLHTLAFFRRANALDIYDRYASTQSPRALAQTRQSNRGGIVGAFLALGHDLSPKTWWDGLAKRPGYRVGVAFLQQHTWSCYVGVICLAAGVVSLGMDAWYIACAWAEQRAHPDTTAHGGEVTKACEGKTCEGANISQGALLNEE